MASVQLYPPTKERNMMPYFHKNQSRRTSGYRGLSTTHRVAIRSRFCAVTATRYLIFYTSWPNLFLSKNSQHALSVPVKEEKPNREETNLCCRLHLKYRDGFFSYFHLSFSILTSQAAFTFTRIHTLTSQ